MQEDHLALPDSREVCVQRALSSVSFSTESHTGRSLQRPRPLGVHLGQGPWLPESTEPTPMTSEH